MAGLYALHHLRELGFSRAGARGGRRCRRHVVLEPLPGRALRRTQSRVLVRLLRGAPAGLGVDRGLPGTGGARALLQPRRRPIRSAARHPAEHARHRSDLRRRHVASGWSRPTAGDTFTLPVLRDGDGTLSVPNVPHVPGPRRRSGARSLQTSRWPRGERRPRGQARRPDRHGIVGRAGDARARRDRGHLYVFQRTPTYTWPSRNGPLDSRGAGEPGSATTREMRRRQRESFGGVTGSTGAIIIAGPRRQADPRGDRGGAARHARRARVRRLAAWSDVCRRIRTPTRSAPICTARWCGAR